MTAHGRVVAGVIDRTFEAGAGDSDYKLNSQVTQLWKKVIEITTGGRPGVLVVASWITAERVRAGRSQVARDIDGELWAVSGRALALTMRGCRNAAPSLPR